VDAGPGIGRETIELFMLAAVLVGLAFQVPVGRLSNRFDRLMVLSVLIVGLAGIAVALVHLPHTLMVVLPAAVLLGAFMSTLYPVCVANHGHRGMPVGSPRRHQEHDLPAATASGKAFRDPGAAGGTPRA
jgi:predicted MFS family arabinose efflux permease